MKYNIIGDIHGMSTWKKLVKKDYVNIFIGDYFSPYPRLRKKINAVGIDNLPDELPLYGNEKDNKIMRNYKVFTPSFEEQKKNFLNIIKYKRANPDTTILLIGNHDEDHWHINEEISRHDYENCQIIASLFEKNKDLFTIAYNIENKALVTHAGVTAFWYENVMDEVDSYRYFERVLVDNVVDGEDVKSAHERWLKGMNEKQKDDAIIQWNKQLWRYDKENDVYRIINVTVGNVCNLINGLWEHGQYKYFDFHHNHDIGDTYGYSKQQGPLWVRDKTLVLNNLFMFTNVKQFVGHTQREKVVYINNVGLTDCLQYNIQSIVYDSEEDKVYKSEGKKKLIDITNFVK